MKSPVIVATLIASIALVIAAVIISSGMQRLGKSIELAGAHSQNHVPSQFIVRLGPAQPSEPIKINLAK